MKKLLAVAGLVIGIAGNALGQAPCGNEIIESQIENDPALKARFDEYFVQYTKENKEMADAVKKTASKGTAEEEVFLVPVVFHLVLTEVEMNQLGKEAGVIDRINTQLAAINEDFNNENTDLSKVPSAFKSVIGKANIRFELAKIDPNGKARAGIEFRIADPASTGFAPMDAAVKKSAKGIEPWDNTKYLNIWVTNLTASGGSTGQVLGYGYNPVYAGQVYSDKSLGGIVMHYLTLGRKTETVKVFYSKSTIAGRTLTHELGHFFNIWHIWGKNVAAGTKDCNQDDGIDDTPLQEQSNFTCHTGYKANCPQKKHPGGEMYMNFMDYSGDTCVIMFTEQQVQRMRKELSTGGQVQTLGKNPELCYWPANISKVEYNNSVSFAPNPSTGIFQVNFVEKYDQLEQIIVTNSLGQLIQQIPVTEQNKMNYTVDLTAQPKGIYHVQLKFDQGIITRKVVLQ